MFGAHLRITAPRARAGPRIELLEYLTPRTDRPYPTGTLDDDYRQWTVNVRTEPNERLEAVTAVNDYSRISSHPIELNDVSLGYRRAFMLRDPDGHATNPTL